MSWGKLFSIGRINWFRASSSVETLPGEEVYEAWLRTNFPQVANKALASRHHRLWRWFDFLERGMRPLPRVEVWPRGGAKSSTGELACAYVASKLTRRYVLYVSETQDQADKHVGAVASLLEKMGVQRLVGKYGHSKGWRRNEVRTATGFNVSAYGLDTAARGVKLDEYRPDLIIFDDIDSQGDGPKAVKKKIDAITTAVIPAGSFDCAVLFLQNLIHEEGVVARLVDGRADFLNDREVPSVEPAVRGLVYERFLRDNGAYGYRITGGEATWEGQPLEVCERQINDWGLRAFLREAQHEVRGADGYFFDHLAFRYIKPEEVTPELLKQLRLCRAWDLAATEGAGDWTVGVLLGMAKNGVVYVLDVVREQFNSKKVRSLVLSTAAEDKRKYGRVKIRLPQDPGQAGKDQGEQYVDMLADYDVVVVPVTGSKATRATGWADKVNGGNAVLVEADWNRAYTEEHRKFREDEDHEEDDQVDPSADSYNELAIEHVVEADDDTHAGFWRSR